MRGVHRERHCHKKKSKDEAPGMVPEVIIYPCRH